MIIPRRRPARTVPERILAVFAAHKNKPLGFRHLAVWLPDVRFEYIAHTCWRLWGQGRLYWYEPGVYGPLPPPSQKEPRRGR
jgi:hypothetical protein